MKVGVIFIGGPKDGLYLELCDPPPNVYQFTIVSSIWETLYYDLKVQEISDPVLDPHLVYRYYYREPSK